VFLMGLCVHSFIFSSQRPGGVVTGRLQVHRSRAIACWCASWTSSVLQPVM
jgi:hypothetical protein